VTIGEIEQVILLRSHRLAVIDQQGRAPDAKFGTSAAAACPSGDASAALRSAIDSKFKGRDRIRRAPGESLHRTVADQIRTQTRNRLSKRDVRLVIVAVKGGRVRRSVVQNEYLGHGSTFAHSQSGSPSSDIFGLRFGYPCARMNSALGDNRADAPRRRATLLSDVPSGTAAAPRIASDIAAYRSVSVFCWKPTDVQLSEEGRSRSVLGGAVVVSYVGIR